MIWIALYAALSLANAFWLRHRLPVCQRLNDMNWQAWVIVDIAGAFLIFWPLFVVGVLKERPLPWATISAMCGGHAGSPWADRGAALIDALFFVATSQRHHCSKAFANWSAPLAGYRAIKSA